MATRRVGVAMPRVNGGDAPASTVAARRGIRHLCGPMLHLMKLCVGVRDPAELRAWQAQRAANRQPLRHLTRHMPRRADEITEGGSIYWVIAGAMLLRQRVTALEPACREDGTACAAIMLDPALVPLSGRPVKAFQGWRYLRCEDAPDDLRADSAEAAMPHELARQLRELCLL